MLRPGRPAAKDTVADRAIAAVQTSFIQLSLYNDYITEWVGSAFAFAARQTAELCLVQMSDSRRSPGNEDDARAVGRNRRLRESVVTGIELELQEGTVQGTAASATSSNGVRDPPHVEASRRAALSKGVARTAT